MIKNYIKKYLGIQERPGLTPTPHWQPYSGTIFLEDGSYLHPTVKIINGVGKMSLLLLGKRAYIDGPSEIDISKSRVVIGENTFIHQGASVYGDVEIGESCLISKNFFASSGMHSFSRPCYIKHNDLIDAENPMQPIRIHDDVWIGYNVFIKSGVLIGKGAVIGAGSVVSKNVYPYTVMGGIPAKVIKKRLEYNPPHILESKATDHFPYFYTGFEQAGREFEENGYKIKKTIALLAIPLDFENGSIEITGKMQGSGQINLVVGTHSVSINDGEFTIHQKLISNDVVIDGNRNRFLALKVLDLKTEVRIRTIVFSR